jgi:hypothetical protein
MRRLTTFMVAPAFVIAIFFLFTGFLYLIVRDTRRARPGVVHLVKDIGGTRDGMITRSEHNIVVESATNGRETFTWSQVAYIEEKDPGGAGLAQIIDLFDVWSKFGIGVTLFLVVVGLQQYGQNQKWEREKFLAGAVKELIEWKPNRSAMHMIDSLALYNRGRMIELFPHEDNPQNRKVFVSNEEIIEALTPTPQLDLDETDVKAVAIRDCFDSFLSYMGTWNHYIQQDLITKEALAAHLGYWMELLGPNGTIDPDYRDRIFNYCRTYGLTEFEELVKRYEPVSWSQKLREWFR